MIPFWFEVTSMIVLTIILIADLSLARMRPHIPSNKESTLWVSFYVTLALIFAGLLWYFASGQYALEFITGWALEYSLSVDNLFVFVLIMAQFAVPKKLQQEVLMVGIMIAIVLRGLFILLGVTLIEHFTPIFYLFGAYLIFVAIKQAMPEHDDDTVAKENLMVRIVRRNFDVSDNYEGHKLFTVENGKRMLTPMLLVYVAIGVTDLMFALDSIPAIFDVTKSGFIVFTANIFALMGLRQLYFLLGGLLEKLKYLHYGIAAILGFIGVKLIMHAMHENELPFINGGQPIAWIPDIPVWVSLVFIAVAMTVATVASLISNARTQDQAVAKSDTA